MGTFVRYKENTQPDRYVSGMKIATYTHQT